MTKATVTYTAHLSHATFGEHDVKIEATSDVGAKRSALHKLRSAGHGWTVQLRNERGEPFAYRARSDRKWTAI